MRAYTTSVRRVLLFGGLYFAGAMFASLFLRTPNDITLFWPSAGVGYAAALMYGPRWALIIPVPMLLFHLLVLPVPPHFLVYSILSNTIATALAAWVVIVTGPRLRLGSNDAWRVLAGGVLLGVVSAGIGTAGLMESGIIEAADRMRAFALWALGDLLGISSVAPCLLLLSSTRPSHTLSPTHETSPLYERMAWTLLLAGSLLALHAYAREGDVYALGLTSLPLMLLLWSALRFSTAWTALAMLATVCYMSLVTGIGVGGFAPPKYLLDSVVLMLLLCLISVIPVIMALHGLEQRTANRDLYRRAVIDGLTGLLNRSAFEERARALLASDESQATLLYVDLDNFKLVNDSASHVAGDSLLRATAGIAADILGNDALLARTGGDEFGALLRCGQADAMARTRRLLAEIEALRVPWDEQVLTTTASIGLVPATAGQRDYDVLFSHADAACFAAKELGGNRVFIAHPQSGEAQARSAVMRSALRVREAMEQNQFVLFCQPIVPLDDIGAAPQRIEVLLRWREPEGRIHLPAEFISAAERFRLGPRLDRHVVAATLGWLERHPEAAADISCCAINLSGTTLVDEEFADYLGARLRRSSFPAENLCFEITETSVVRDRGQAQRFIRQMREMGCRFALDDFGTGFCSFSYLRDLDVDFLKIDGSFVRDLEESELAQAVVRSIAEIAHVLGKATIAEHVETDAQRLRMQLMGVDFGQGYLFGKPLSFDQYFGMR